MSQEAIDKIYWDALKMNQPGDPDSSFLDLGGNSVGIFKITTEIQKSQGVKINPVIFLSKEGTLNNLKNIVSEEMEAENV